MKIEKDSYVFRLLTKNDIDQLYDLLNSLPAVEKQFFYPHPFDKHTLLENCSSTKDHFFVMEQKGKIIGYSFLRLFSYTTPSFGCCIRKEYQGQGYGSLLTEETMNKAKEQGHQKVILKVYKENTSAITIYEHIGFKILGETEDKKQYKMEKAFISKD